MQVGISESFLAAVFVGYDGYDNSVFNSVGSESSSHSTVSRIWIPHFLCLQRFDFVCFFFGVCFGTVVTKYEKHVENWQSLM